MGLFRDFRNFRAKEGIHANGLSQGDRMHCCENCQLRMQDPKSSYLVCAQLRRHVSAEQVCGDFVYGDPRYELR